MITIENLSKSFSQHIAVNIPHLTIAQGELLGIVGNNGAGKTTTFRLMLDLLRADSGRVLQQGVDVARSEAWKAYTGAFVDSGFLIDFLTPDEYFALTGKLYGLSSAQIKERLGVFEQFMAGEIVNQRKYIRHFSSGNKQKIGIVAAMLVHPQLLILDEPFNYLDPSSQIEMKHLLKWFNTEWGTTIVISSHNLNYVSEVSSRVLLLEQGQILKDVKKVGNSSTIEEVYEYFER